MLTFALPPCFFAMFSSRFLLISSFLAASSAAALSAASFSFDCVRAPHKGQSLRGMRFVTCYMQQVSRARTLSPALASFDAFISAFFFLCRGARNGRAWVSSGEGKA